MAHSLQDTWNPAPHHGPDSSCLMGCSGVASGYMLVEKVGTLGPPSRGPSCLITLRGSLSWVDQLLFVETDSRF